MKVPPGLSSTASELSRVGGQLLRIVSHNRAVFGAHYTEILEGALPRLDANRMAQGAPEAGAEAGAGAVAAGAAEGTGGAEAVAPSAQQPGSDN